MRANVFTDASLERFAGQFAWLAWDTEKTKNAALRKKFVVEGLPTYFVVDPTTEKVIVRWVGSATAAQLAKLFDETSRKLRPPKESAPNAADQALANGDRLYGEGKTAAAIADYETALAAAPADWKPYSRTVEALFYAYSRAGESEKTLALAKNAWPRLRQSPSMASVAASGLGAALDLPPEHPERAALIAEFTAGCRRALTDSSLGISGDDKSGVYQALIAARVQEKDEAGATKLRREWSEFLDREAAAAKSPEARVVFDSHRLTAYLDLGEPERAIPMLEQSAKDAPGDYNPPARLAIAYEAMKKWDEAIAASDRALKLVYGPRRLVVLDVRARLFLGKGDPAGARAVLEEAIRTARELPEGQRSEARITSLEKRLEELPKQSDR